MQVEPLDWILTIELVQYLIVLSHPTNVRYNVPVCSQAPAELGFEDRLSMEDSQMVLDQVRAADAGQFKITDILGFTVSSIHLEILRKRWRVCTVAALRSPSRQAAAANCCNLNTLMKVS